MRTKLWRIDFKSNNPAYWGDHDHVTVNAPNAKEAMNRAIRSFKGVSHRQLQNITDIELVAKED